MMPLIIFSPGRLGDNLFEGWRNAQQGINLQVINISTKSKECCWIFGGLEILVSVTDMINQLGFFPASGWTINCTENDRELWTIG